jgi:hypothetical protein
VSLRSLGFCAGASERFHELLFEDHLSCCGNIIDDDDAAASVLSKFASKLKFLLLLVVL